MKDIKRYTTVYDTFWGGKTMMRLDFDGSPVKGEWEYTCIYGRLRFCYSEHTLKDGWKQFSIHWNNVKNNGIAWNFHLAYCKFRFVIGFDNIWNKKMFVDQ